MVDISFTIVMQWINFGILLFLLHRFLFKPLLGFLDKRAKTIEGHIEEALNDKEKAIEVLNFYNGRLSDIKSEADALIAEARKKANEERLTILEEARSESKQLIQSAKDDIQHEVEKSWHQLKRDVSGLVISCTHKILQREVNAQDHERAIEEFLQTKGM